MPAKSVIASDDSSSSKGLLIHTVNDDLYALELTDGLEIQMANGSLIVEHPTKPVNVEIDRISRIDYGPIPDSAMPEVGAYDARISLVGGKMTITPASEGMLEVFNLSGQRLISEWMTTSGTEIDISRFNTEPLIVTLNHNQLIKLCNRK